MQASIEAGCIWYLLSSDSPGHTFIRAARCYNITPIWPGSNRRPYRPACSPQRVGGFKFCPPTPSPPQGLSLGFLASSLQGPSTPKTGSDCGRRWRISGTLGEKFCVPCRLGGGGGWCRPPARPVWQSLSWGGPVLPAPRCSWKQHRPTIYFIVKLETTTPAAATKPPSRSYLSSEGSCQHLVRE